MLTNETIRLAEKNGSLAANYFGPIVTIADVVSRLADCCNPSRHAAVKYNAPVLLNRMAGSNWILAAGPHAGGFGGRHAGADQNSHITIMLGGGGYHLRLDKKGHIFSITGPGMKVFFPWASPGTDVGGHYRGQ
jgi:hypothetical protein